MQMSNLAKLRVLEENAHMIMLDVVKIIIIAVLVIWLAAEIHVSIKKIKFRLNF
jgi:hypothetical protein